MQLTQSTRRQFVKATGSLTLFGLAGCTAAENDGPDDEAWEDIDEFAFEGRVEGWTGLEPAVIEGEDNPTLILLEGQEYDFRWVNKDGAIHNLEIRDANDEVVDGYASEDLDDVGEEVVLENVVATSEMAKYVCRFHQGTQEGSIDVRNP